MEPDEQSTVIRANSSLSTPRSLGEGHSFTNQRRASGYFNLKIRPPSGAVNVGVEQSERRGGTWRWGIAAAGPRRALLPVRRQDASPKRSAPVPPLVSSQGRVHAPHRQIQSSRPN